MKILENEIKFNDIVRTLYEYDGYKERKQAYIDIFELFELNPELFIKACRKGGKTGEKYTELLNKTKAEFENKYKYGISDQTIAVVRIALKQAICRNIKQC